MIKKILISGIVLALTFCNFVSASEVTGDLSNQIETGISGTLKSAPVFSLDSGTYNSTQSVTLTASGSTAICYSLSEDNPSCSNYNTCSSGTKYASAISVTTTTNIKAVACYADNTQGPVSATKTYTLACATSSVSNGIVGAYPSCTITCNSGYTLSGSSCVTSSGGGGGSSGGSSSGGSSSYTPPVTTTNTTTTVSPITTQQTTNTATVLTNLGLNLPFNNPTNESQNSANRTYLINYLVNLIASLNSQRTIQQPVQNNPSVGPFNRTLTLGMNNDDVKDLQEFLVSQGEAIYPEKQVTGYFGNLTLLAIGRFQIAQGIVSGPSDGGYGIVGPLTRSRINSILGY